MSKTFEYRIVEMGCSRCDSRSADELGLPDLLNQLGDEGWQLIQMSSDRLILVREKA